MIASFLVQTLNGLASASLLFLVALGLSLIFGVTRVVNFAHGALYMLGAYLGVTINAWLGGGIIGFWGAVVLAGVVVGMVGGLAEMAILRRIYRAPELLQLITTFGIALVLKDAVLYLWGPEDILGARAPGLAGAVPILGKPFPTYDLLLLALGPLMLALVWLLLTRTVWGTRVRAATEDRDMAAALGINQAWMFTGVFMLGSALAGVAGALALPREPANLGMDIAVIADVFVVTVVGGLGSLPGAYLAAVVISVVKAWCIGIGDVTFAGFTVSFPKLTLVAEFVVMAIVLMVRPWGLFGRAPPPDRLAAAAIQPMPPPVRSQIRVLAVAAAVLIALPLVVDRFTIVLMTDIVIFALFAASLALVMGIGGMASFGHAAYFGAGAYAAAIAAKAGVPFPLALGAGVVMSMGLGAFFGAFLVRLSGVSLAMLTLAFAQIVWAIAFQWDSVTGGSNGLLGIWPPAAIAGKTAYYYVALAIAGVAIAGLWRTVHAPWGYQLRAARDSRRRADSVGIEVARMHWQAIVVAGGAAGLAGGLFVFSKGSLSPDTLTIPRSMDALAMVLLGGVQTLTGPLVGALVFVGLQDWIVRATPYWHAVLGAVVVAITIAFPQGIVGSIARLRAERAHP